MIESPSRSLLDDAKTLLEQNGSLSETALILEAAIQQGQLGEGGYEAWILLGETRNMDEREEAGMKALIEGVRMAEQSGTPGPGMLVCTFLCFAFHSLTAPAVIGHLFHKRGLRQRVTLDATPLAACQLSHVPHSR
jgi:hypothetical protein